MDLLTPDIQEYLVQAVAEELAAQGLQLLSKEDFAQWIENNIEGVAKRAMSLQVETYKKFCQHKELVETVAASKVWLNIRNQANEGSAIRYVTAKTQ